MVTVMDYLSAASFKSQVDLTETNGCLRKGNQNKIWEIINWNIKFI